MRPTPAPPPLELWVGAECTINRIGDRWRDQSELTGFARRPDDLARLASLGARCVRLPVLWERAAANPGRLDFGWADDALARLRSTDLQPIVGLLHHGSGPHHTSLVDARFPALFADYARQVAERFPHVQSWTPINEPLTTARFSCLYGLWYPHATDDASFVRALLNQVRATVLAMRAIRSVIPSAQLVQTDDVGCTRATPALAEQAAFDNERRWLGFDLLCGRVDDRHPLWDWLRACGADAEALMRLCEAPCPPDIVGVNAYATSERFLDDRLHLHPPHLHGGNGRQAYADVETARAHGVPIDGFGARLRETHARYGLPVALTEVHMGCTREEQLRWLQQAWTAAIEARVDGVDVRGVTAWAAFGTMDWASLLTRDDGHYEPGLWDARSEPPRLTALGRLAAALGHGEAPERSAVPPVLAGPGWWQRDLRWAVTPHGEPTALAAQGQTLLVVGRGALAHGFARLSHMRGLPYEWRERVDDLRPEALLDLMQSHEVWAVVEASADAAGHARLAAACHAQPVRLLTVHINGLAGDAPAVRDDGEADTLHLHTGTPFGPWSGADDIVAAGLARLARGETWVADADALVSPTYIPDLVQAALDLLIDGEVGRWHVAHGEPLSEWDFARRAARHGGLDESFVRRAIDAAPQRALVHALPLASAPRLLPPLDDALARYRHDYDLDPCAPPALAAATTRASDSARGPRR